MDRPLKAIEGAAIVGHPKIVEVPTHFAPHCVPEVRECARVALLAEPAIELHQGTPQSLRERAFGARVRIRFAGPADAYAQTLRDAGLADVRVNGDTLSIGPAGGGPRTPDIVRRLAGAGADIEAVEPEEPSLEQVYLRLLEGERP